MEEWADISRNTHKLTEFLSKLGVQGCEIEEIYSLENLEESKHVHGIFLLFQYNFKILKKLYLQTQVFVY